MMRSTSAREEPTAPPAPAVPDTVLLAVVAAHRVGQPLHPELVALGGRFVRRDVTAPVYRMLALPGPGVARGGIARVRTGGARVEVELYALPTTALGPLVWALPAPLAVGRVELDDATAAHGLLCTHEPDGAIDVSEHRSWLAYLAAPSGASAW